MAKPLIGPITKEAAAITGSLEGFVGAIKKMVKGEDAKDVTTKIKNFIKEDDDELGLLKAFTPEEISQFYQIAVKQSSDALEDTKDEAKKFFADLGFEAPAVGEPKKMNLVDPKTIADGTPDEARAKAKKFFFQRLFLTCLEDEESLLKVETDEELNKILAPEITPKKLFFLAKFEDLKASGKLPEEVEFKDFMRIAKVAIKDESRREIEEKEEVKKLSRFGEKDVLGAGEEDFSKRFRKMLNKDAKYNSDLVLIGKVIVKLEDPKTAKERDVFKAIDEARNESATAIQKVFRGFSKGRVAKYTREHQEDAEKYVAQGVEKRAEDAASEWPKPLSAGDIAKYGVAEISGSGTGDVKQEESGFVMATYRGRDGLCTLHGHIHQATSSNSNSFSSAFAKVVGLEEGRSLHICVTNTGAGANAEFLADDTLEVERKKRAKDDYEAALQHQVNIGCITEILNLMIVAKPTPGEDEKRDEMIKKLMRCLKYEIGPKDEKVEDKVKKMEALKKEVGAGLGDFKDGWFLSEEQKKAPESDAAKAIKKRADEAIKAMDGKSSTKSQRDWARKFVAEEVAHFTSVEADKLVFDNQVKVQLSDTEKNRFFAGDNRIALGKISDEEEGRVKTLLDVPDPIVRLKEDGTPVCGISVLRPKGTNNMRSIVFSGSKGDKEFYAYLEGTEECYVRVRRVDTDCTPPNSPMMVYRDGKLKTEAHAVGDIVIDEMIFQRRSDGKYNEIDPSAKTFGTSALTEAFGGNSAKADYVRGVYENFQIKAISIDDEGNRKKMAVLSSGKTYSHDLLKRVVKPIEAGVDGAKYSKFIDASGDMPEVVVKLSGDDARTVDKSLMIKIGGAYRPLVDVLDKAKLKKMGEEFPSVLPEFFSKSPKDLKGFVDGVIDEYKKSEIVTATQQGEAIARTPHPNPHVKAISSSRLGESKHVMRSTGGRSAGG